MQWLMEMEGMRLGSSVSIRNHDNMLNHDMASGSWVATRASSFVAVNGWVGGYPWLWCRATEVVLMCVLI